MVIQVLPEQVVAQIAAGEVVERPASVVKELVENAIDAGAGNIRVSVTQGGRKMIRISDDGVGIPQEEVLLAVTRHATSKLRTVNDLMTLSTLGFRGEALSSIAAVSRFTLVTRHREAAMGVQVRLEGGQVLNQQAIGAPVGTIVTVENLFYNTPARLKFLKKENTEKRQVAAIITRYAMAYPDIRFVLEQDGREVFRSSGSGQLADVVVNAMGLDNFKQMVDVSSEDEARDGRPNVVVYGYTSMPDYNRSDRSQITLFVNGRWIQDSSLAYAVVQAYHTLLMNGRYPVSVLLVDIAPEEVDVNVHPTKAEVRFRDPNAVFAAVQRAVRQAVIANSETPYLRHGRYGGFATGGAMGNAPAPEPIWGNRNPSRRPPRPSESEQLEMDLDDPGEYRSRRATRPIDPTEIPEGPGVPLKPRTLPVLRVVGQVGAMYIVAEGPNGMYLIDQHAAHERVLYEQMMEAFERQELVVQHTLAQTIDLAAEEAQLVEGHLHTLERVGIMLEPFGPSTFMIRAVPGLLADSDPVQVILSIVDDLMTDKQPGRGAIEERIIRRVCRYGAVKAGQVLSQDEMRSIIHQLERCHSPHTCPHGRPTMLHMSGDQLAREFGRA
ncbi:MAG: DNA mismatch repair endonuclease MutL [Anaerolineae bacterium]